MPIKIKGADGNEILHYSQEEVDTMSQENKEKLEGENKVAIDAARNEAVELYKKDHPENTEELTKLQTDLKTAQDELAVLKNDPNMTDGQKSRLLTKITELETNLNATLKSSTEKISQLESQMVGNKKGEMLDKLSRGDVELRKKIEFEFDNYMPNATDPGSINQRMEKAHQLATGGKPMPNMMDNAGGAGDRGEGGNFATKTNEPTESEKQVGNMLGVTDADRQKYGKMSATNPGQNK